MLLKRYRKLIWPVVKLDVTFSVTRHISDWRIRRVINALLVPFYILKHIRPVFSRKLNFPQIGLTITRRCVLNCIDCVALYTHYRERRAGDIPLEELSATIERFLAAVDGVNSFGLGGGEPFLHKDFKTLLNQALASPKVNLVRTYTTGMPIPDDDVLDAMATPRFAMGISDYGDLSKTMRKLLPKLESRGITHRVEQNSWTDFGGFEKRNRSTRDSKKVFASC